MACATSLAVLAAAWRAGEKWLGWDRSTAVTVAIFVATLALTVVGWWAAKSNKVGERSSSPNALMAVDGVAGGHIVVGNNNTLTSQTAGVSVTQHIEVGEGAGSRRHHLARAYERAGGESAIGRARSTAVKANGGHLQAFDDLANLRSFVIWAPPRGGCVVMPESVWEALCAVGDTDGDTDFPDLAGYPIPTNPDPTIIDDRTLEILLSGGQWPDGTLRRATPDSTWAWEPKPRLETNLSHWTKWPRDVAFDLRLRAIVDIAWLTPGLLKSSDERRDELLAAAAAGRFSNLFDILGQGYGTNVTTPPWGIAKNSNYNWARGIHICAVLTDADGQPVVQANVMMQVPGDNHAVSLLGCVDLHINLERLNRLTSADGVTEAPPKMKLSAMLHILRAAVGNAVDILPDLVVNDLEDQLLARPPFVETLVETGQLGTETQRYLTLADVLDLAPLGDLPKSFGSQQAGSRIVGPRQLGEQDRLRFLADGFVEVAVGWGFATLGKAAMVAAICK